MARVTVEDCVDKVPNRFDLVLASAQRARQISSGASPLVERDNDKNPVVALREIADEMVQPDDLREAVILSQRKVVESDEPEEVDMSILTAGMEETTAPAVKAPAVAAPVAEAPAEPSAEESDGALSIS